MFILLERRKPKKMMSLLNMSDLAKMYHAAETREERLRIHKVMFKVAYKQARDNHKKARADRSRTEKVAEVVAKLVFLPGTLALPFVLRDYFNRLAKREVQELLEATANV